MTERIKELALQSADEIADLFSPGFFDDRMVYDIAEINRKFAELIVRECASKVDWIYSEKGKTADGVEYTVTQGDLIREHFGVKE